MKLPRPIVVIGAPRSGTTFLTELLSLHPDLWHLPAESHHILEGPLHPKHFSSFSNRPDQEFSLSKVQIDKIRSRFCREAININAVPGGRKLLNTVRGNRFLRKGVLQIAGGMSKFFRPQALARIRFLEKTPKNIVRIPVIQQLFPDARFIYLKRNAIDNIYSIYQGWVSQTGLLYEAITGRPRFARYGYELDFLKELGIKEKYWKFVLPPGWEKQDFSDVLDISIFQYLASNRWAEQDLQNLGSFCKVTSIQYEKLSSNTEAVVRKLLSFAGLSINAYDFDSLRKLPKINVTYSPAENDTIKLEIADRLAAIKTDFNLEK